MLEAATQQGVEKEETAVPTNNPRNDALKQIADRVAQQSHEDIQAENAQYFPPEDQVAETPETQQAAPSYDDEMVSIKVDGEIRQVPKKLVEEAGIRSLQKESAADKRLEEATRLYKEAEQLRNTLQPSQDVAQPQQPSHEDVAQVLANAIRYGSDEDANIAIKRLQELNKVDPNQLLAVVEDRLDHKNAVEQFRTEYKDIADDPYLRQVVIQGYHLFRQNGDRRPHAEIYKQIGQELREWKGGLATPSTFEEKTERKSSITNVPSANARRAAPEQPKPKTPSEIIEGMRKARHQI